jgi:hypothetical protein
MVRSQQVNDFPARPGEIDPPHIKPSFDLRRTLQKSFNGRAVRAEKGTAFVVVKTRFQQKQRRFRHEPPPEAIPQFA